MGIAPVLTSLHGGNTEEHNSDSPLFRLNILICYSKQAWRSKTAPCACRTIKCRCLMSSCTVSPQVRWRCRALTATSMQPSLQCSPCMWFWLCLFTWPGMKACRKGRAKTTRTRPHRLVRPQEMDRHRPAALQPQASTPNTPPCTKRTAWRSGLHLGFDLSCLSSHWCRRSEPDLFVFEWLLKGLSFDCYLSVKRDWSWRFVINCWLNPVEYLHRCWRVNTVLTLCSLNV